MRQGLKWWPVLDSLVPTLGGSPFDFCLGHVQTLGIDTERLLVSSGICAVTGFDP